MAAALAYDGASEPMTLSVSHLDKALRFYSLLFSLHLSMYARRSLLLTQGAGWIVSVLSCSSRTPPSFMRQEQAQLHLHSQWMEDNVMEV